MLGCTILNYISARHVQLATSQWTIGKASTRSLRWNPRLWNRDKIDDPRSLEIKLSSDRDVLQHSSTKHLILKLPDLIVFSAVVPLDSGDVIRREHRPALGWGEAAAAAIEAGRKCCRGDRGHWKPHKQECFRA